MEFTSRRTRTLARLAAYTVLVIFLCSVLAKVFPLPLSDSSTALNALSEVIERSSLPIFATTLLYMGMTDDALPAYWECRFSL